MSGHLRSPLQLRPAMESFQGHFHAVPQQAPQTPKDQMSGPPRALQVRPAKESFQGHFHADPQQAQAAAAKTNEALHLRSVGKIEEAQRLVTEAISLDPRNSLAFALLGDLFSTKNQWQEAIENYRYALALRPDWHEVRTTMASVFKSLEQYENAIELAREAVANKPDDGRALETLTQAQFFVCDWTDYERLLNRLTLAVDKEIADGKVPTLTPWHVSTYPLAADFVLRLTQAHAKGIATAASKLGCPPLRHPPRAPLRPRERLRIAYVSSEFNDHPVSHLMGSMFELHDRSLFEVFCFSIRASDNSKWRRRIEQSVEHFVEVGHLDTVSIAKRISEAGIHIAINLNGFTKSDRNQAFALRFAPLQIQFLGFPGAMCASWLDYSVADEVVCPPKTHKYYTEALALLPDSMIPTDHKQAHSDLLGVPPPPRQELGLPEDAVVYACSNQLFKITPDLWAMWCRILKRVPNSVLWLQKSPAAAEPRLRKEFERHGLDQKRLIFTGRCPKPEYMRRQGAADVFLDTPIYNAYTTGADNLWSGTPIVTMPLDRMASRAAASLCNAVGVPEMIVDTFQEYEDLAVELGKNPEKRQQLRRQIQEHRLTCPLYDTARFVRQFERMLLHMWNHHAAGEEPQTFRVRDTPSLPPLPEKPASAASRVPPQSAPSAKLGPMGTPLVMPKTAFPVPHKQDPLAQSLPARLPPQGSLPPGAPPLGQMQMQRPFPAAQLCQSRQVPQMKFAQGARQASFGVPAAFGSNVASPAIRSSSSVMPPPMIAVRPIGLQPFPYFVA